MVHGNQSVSETTNVSNSQACSREAECSGRLALEKRADNSYRVDSPQRHSVPDISFLESSSYRSICHKAQQSTSSFHISVSRPIGMGSGCDVPVMGGNDSICISSHSSSNEGLTENGERNLSAHPDSASLGESSILPSPAISDDCTNSQASCSEGSFDPASFPSSSSEAGNLQPARLAVLQGGLKKARFSMTRESVPQRELPHSLSITTAGTLGWIGVYSGRWIPSIHL